MAGKRFGAPPKKGPNAQSFDIDYMKDGKMSVVSKSKVKELHDKLKGLKIGALSDLGCPHRENGVQGSDIQGIKPLQVKGKKFTGVK